jgi:hypothetical protein
MQHYLISVPLPGGYMHGYVMSEGERHLSTAIERMSEETEKRGLPMSMPMILQTQLADGWKLVREIILKRTPKAAERWETAKEVFLVVWPTHDRDPDQQRLLDLH